MIRTNNDRRRFRVAMSFALACFLLSLTTFSADAQPKGDKGKKATPTAESVEALARALRDPDSDARADAILALRQIGKQPKSDAPRLVERALLAEMAAAKDPELRGLVAGLVGELRSHTDTGIAALIQWMDDPQPEVRAAAFTSFIRNFPKGSPSGEFRDPIVAGLHDKDVQTRRAVALEVVKSGKGRVDSLVQVISTSAQPSAVADALLALDKIGPKPEHRAVLVASLRVPNVIVRERAFAALLKIEPRFVIESGLLDEPDLRVFLLNRIRPFAPQKVPTDADRKAMTKIEKTLIVLLRDKDEETRVAAARAVRRLTFFLSDGIMPLLKDPNADVRRAAVQALDAKFNVAAIKDLMGDEKRFVREAVAEALAKQGAGAFNALGEALRSDNALSRSTAASALAATVERADALIPPLVDAFLADDSDDRDFSAAILRVEPLLGSRELARKADVAALVALLKKPAAETQTLACLALVEKGAAAAEAVPALVELANRPKSDVAVTSAALRALHVLAPKKSAELVTPEFVDRLVADSRAKSQLLRAEAMALQSSNFEDDSVESILASLYVGEFVEWPNEWLVHHCSGNASIGSATPLFVRILGLFHEGNKRFPRRLRPEVELALKDHCWRLVNDPALRNRQNAKSLYVPPADATGPVDAERLEWATSLYLVLDVLKDDPAYSYRKLGGQPLQDLHKEWSRWLRDWARGGAVVGVWSDLSHPSRQLRVWACLLNVHDCAKDPALKQSFKMLLDLSFIEDEQLSVHGNRGVRRGSGARPESNLQEWKDVLLGDASRRLTPDPSGMRGALWTTSYEMPVPMVLLRKTPRPVERYAVKNYRGTNGSLTAYVSPHYVLASHTGVNYYAGEFGGAWDRLVFDDMNAVFFTPRMWREAVQIQNLTLQRCVFAPKPRRSITYSTSLTTVQKKGWIFLSNGHGYAAILIPGGYERFAPLGTVDVIQPARGDPMAIVQAGDKQTFGSFEDFQTAILKAPLRITATSLQYTGPNLPPVEFFMDWKQPTLVDGVPFVARDEAQRFDGPYLRGAVDSPQVAVHVGPYAATYDFEKNSVVPLRGQ